ncbi:MAG: ribonuclease III [Candidatus Sericytochromatia bacterium]|nr:ribonuclease III [Candidatus Sericytochromatia bacterium]
MTQAISSLLERAGLPGPHEDARYSAALTHPSSESRPHYERLEFLGDAVLKLVVSDWLYAQKSPLSEGAMTQVRAQTVSDETLSLAARRLNLGPHLILGTSEKRSGGREKTSILASAFEALLGAIYEIHGLGVAGRFLKEWLSPEFEQALTKKGQDNYKAVLQELTQKKWQCLPTYAVTEEPPAAGRSPLFTVEVSLHGERLAQAQGSSKRQASQRAAELALKNLDTPKEVPCE